MEELEKKKVEMQLWVLKIMAMTLASIMVSVVAVLMVGLFLPNETVDNNEIFKIIGPAFSMVVGAFVGSFATMMGMKTESLDPNAKLQQLGTTDYSKVVDAYHNSDEDHGPF